MSDFEIRGADDFYRLSKALKEAGHTGKGSLRNELNKRIRDATKPLIRETRENAARTLPSRGGFAARVAKAPQRVQTRTGRDPGVRIVVGKRRGDGAQGANRGTIRHPVFGRDQFVSQRVTPGWFDKPLEAGASKVRPEIEKAIESVAEQVVKGVRRG